MESGKLAYSVKYNEYPPRHKGLSTSVVEYTI